jgi:hypothetical protein
MARAIIGGIVLSTLVTLVMVPVFYVMLENLMVQVRTLVRQPAATGRPEEAVAQ